MTKKELIARWHILKKRIEKTGAAVELDTISVHQIVVIVNTQEGVLSELIEWGFEAWTDVKACYQSQSDQVRYFGVIFRRPKGWTPEKDEEEDD